MNRGLRSVHGCAFKNKLSALIVPPPPPPPTCQGANTGFPLPTEAPFKALARPSHTFNPRAPLKIG